MTAVFVTGTGTEIGKTWVLVRLVAELAAGDRAVHVRKPAQSFEPDELGRTDAELLAAASGEEPTLVCPAHRWYPVAMAPCMAAAALDRDPFTTAELAKEVRAGLDPAALTFVEGAGGPRSPLSADGDSIDLARELGAALVVLVADAGLGTINSVRLCVEALSGFPVVTILNRYDEREPVHAANLVWLRDAGYRVAVTVTELAGLVAARVP